MIEPEYTLEMDISEIDINTAEQMATYHHDLVMNHRRAMHVTLGAFDRRNKQELAAQLHWLAAELFRGGKREDAHWFSLVADRLSDRLEMGDWR